MFHYKVVRKTKNLFKLYPHQREAINKLKNGSVLCGGVGSGKSITAIGYYYEKVCKGLIKPFAKMKKPIDLYIITTAKKRDSLEWEADMAPFLLSTTDNLDYNKVKVTVDSWNNIKKYSDTKNSFFIFDEQRVVGYGVWSKTFIKISKKNKWILLTATPGDTWSDYIPVFIANKFYKNKTEFERNHVVYSRFTKFPKIDRYVGTKKLTKHQDDILVYMSCERHTVSENKTIFLPHNKKEEKDIMVNRWNIYTDEPIINAAEMCYLLRKSANSIPERVSETIKIIKRHRKVIIFYNHTYELNILRDMCEDQNYIYAEWNGEKHEEVPKGKSWVYLVQYTAGAEGWNCITTNTIIFYSQNYSYKTMIQAAGRIDRINTPYTDLFYYHLRSSAKIDVAIKQALVSKKNFNIKVFDSSRQKLML